MSGNGAYPEEMDFSHPDIANFSRAVRATLVTEPDPTASAAMVRRLADEARASATIAAERAHRPTSALPPARRGGARRRLIAVGLAVAALPLLTAGLAVAGVKLPDAAESAFEAVGIDLPNQDASDSAGSAGEQDQGSGNDGAPGTSPAAEPGGEAAVKGGKRRGKGPPDHSNAGGNQNPGSASNGKAKGKPAAPPGQSKPKPGNSGGGNSNAGGNGKGVGKGGTPPGQAKKPASPPGQANKPASPGNSGSAGDNGQGQGGGKPPKE